MKSARILLTAKALRAFGDGFATLLLPMRLLELGLGPAQMGAIATLALLGSAALTLAVALAGHRADARRLLMAACGLTLLTGLGVAGVSDFWLLALVAFIGTLNPSSGDVSVFVPLEQALLAHAGDDAGRTRRFAFYNVAAAGGGAVGALSIRLVDPLSQVLGVTRIQVIDAAFVLYGLIGIAALLLYRALPKAPVASTATPPAPLGPSRGRVMKLAALFSLDSFGGGFLVQSLLAFWLYHRFQLSLRDAGAFFFAMGLLGGASQFAAAWLAPRIGLVNTMVFTHIPANLCVIAAAFAPSLPVALGLLTVRAALSSMDVPARTSYVMAVVTPAERAAAAGVTNVPRSLAATLSPALAGWMFGAAVFPWPLLIGGGIKVAYDLLLLAQFRAVRPPEETQAASS